MKPPKPRIKKPRLNWKFEKHKNIWTPYYRITWTSGGKIKSREIKLDWKGDSRLLDALYWECASGRHKKQIPVHQKSWGALITAWRSDLRQQKTLSLSTKKSYNRVMESILAKNAAKEVRHTTRKDLRAIHDALADTPRKADWYIQIVSKLWNYANQSLEWELGNNPAAQFKLYGKQSEFLPWPEWLVKCIEDAPEAVRIACGLILNTGQRPQAAITMKHTDFNGSYVWVVDQKSKERFEIFCPDDLSALHDSIQKKGAYLIAKNISEPLGYNAIEKQFRQWRNSLGPEAKAFSMHGLRKLSIIRLAEAGCSDAEIQSITNQTSETITYYRRRANRKVLSRNAFGKRKGD